MTGNSPHTLFLLYCGCHTNSQGALQVYQHMSIITALGVVFESNGIRGASHSMYLYWLSPNSCGHCHGHCVSSFGFLLLPRGSRSSLKPSLVVLVGPLCWTYPGLSRAVPMSPLVLKDSFPDITFQMTFSRFRNTFKTTHLPEASSQPCQIFLQLVEGSLSLRSSQGTLLALGHSTCMSNPVCVSWRPLHLDVQMTGFHQLGGFLFFNHNFSEHSF